MVKSALVPLLAFVAGCTAFGGGGGGARDAADTLAPDAGPALGAGDSLAI
jgi:hypothetical protein